MAADPVLPSECNLFLNAGLCACVRARALYWLPTEPVSEFVFGNISINCIKE